MKTIITTAIIALFLLTGFKCSSFIEEQHKVGGAINPPKGVIQKTVEN
jgi:hypothetical protein